MNVMKNYGVELFYYLAVGGSNTLIFHVMIFMGFIVLEAYCHSPINNKQKRTFIVQEKEVICRQFLHLKI